MATTYTHNSSSDKDITLSSPIAGDVHDFQFNNYDYAIRLVPGVYTIQCWGGQGGYQSSAGSDYGGKGGYAQGTLLVNHPIVAVVHVGGSGANYGRHSSIGTNHGHGGYSSNTNHYGGAATDVHLNCYPISDTGFGVYATYFEPIIIAGGGGGQGGAKGSSDSDNDPHAGGAAGYASSGGSGTGGYAGGMTKSAPSGVGNTSWTNLYQGANSNSPFNDYYGNGGAGLSLDGGVGGGGGGGFFGGVGVIPDDSYNDDKGGGGGSNFVLTTSNYSTYYENGNYLYEHCLSNATTINGNSSMPVPLDSSSTETGHTGDGRCIITIDQIFTDLTFNDKISGTKYSMTPVAKQSITKTGTRLHIKQNGVDHALYMTPAARTNTNNLNVKIGGNRYQPYQTSYSSTLTNATITSTRQYNSYSTYQTYSTMSWTGSASSNSTAGSLSTARASVLTAAYAQANANGASNTPTTYLAGSTANIASSISTRYSGGSALSNWDSSSAGLGYQSNAYSYTSSTRSYRVSTYSTYDRTGTSYVLSITRRPTPSYVFTVSNTLWLYNNKWVASMVTLFHTSRISGHQPYRITTSRFGGGVYQVPHCSRIYESAHAVYSNNTAVAPVWSKISTIIASKTYYSVASLPSVATSSIQIQLGGQVGSSTYKTSMYAFASSAGTSVGYWATSTVATGYGTGSCYKLTKTMATRTYANSGSMTVTSSVQAAATITNWTHSSSARATSMYVGLSHRTWSTCYSVTYTCQGSYRYSATSSVTYSKSSTQYKTGTITRLSRSSFTY